MVLFGEQLRKERLRPEAAPWQMMYLDYDLLKSECVYANIQSPSLLAQLDSSAQHAEVQSGSNPTVRPALGIRL